MSQSQETAMPENRQRLWIARLALVLISTFMALFVLEVGVRLMASISAVGPTNPIASPSITISNVPCVFWPSEVGTKRTMSVS